MLRDLKRLESPWLLARQSKVLSGTVAVTVMPRLAELLAPKNTKSGDSGEDEAAFEFRFESGPDLGGEEQALASLEVAATVTVTCQRSLEPFSLRLERRSDLAFFASEEALALCPENRDPVLVPGGRMPLLDLLEDELILAMPDVPINPDAELPENPDQPDGQALDEESGGGVDGKTDDRSEYPGHSSAEDSCDGSDDREQSADRPEQRNKPFSDLARLLRDK